MKIWQSFGAEHSLKLVIIGKFKSAGEAKEFDKLISKIEDYLNSQSEFEIESDRFPSSMWDFLRSIELYSLNPHQLSQLFFESSRELNGSEIKVYSDDDLNVFASLMVLKGAKVEMYSTHSYPETDQEEK